MRGGLLLLLLLLLLHVPYSATYGTVEPSPSLYFSSSQHVHHKSILRVNGSASPHPHLLWFYRKLEFKLAHDGGESCRGLHHRELVSDALSTSPSERQEGKIRVHLVRIGLHASARSVACPALHRRVAIGSRKSRRIVSAKRVWWRQWWWRWGRCFLAQKRVHNRTKHT